MKYNNKELWEKFKKSAAKNLESVGYDKLKEIWSSKDAITEFYKNKLFDKIAKDKEIDLEYPHSEYLTVDAIFYSRYRKGDYSLQIPIICIESENEPDGITDSELYKFCFLNAPLKVIFTWLNEWYPENWTTGEWNYIINGFIETTKLVGYLGFIIAVQKEKHFIFYSIVYDENGNVTNEKELVVIK